MGKRRIRTSQAEVSFDRHTPEAEIGAYIDQVRTSGQAADLLPLLQERHPLYKGRGTNQAVRIRGYLLASFAGLGLPARVLPFVLEDLYNSRSPYLVAGAAIALRGMEAPSPQVISYLWEAAFNIQFKDDNLSFESYAPKWPLQEPTSGLREIFRTFAWMGGYAKSALPDLEKIVATPDSYDKKVMVEIRKAVEAIRTDNRKVEDCCELPTGRRAGLGNGKRPHLRQIANVTMEDQFGHQTTLGEFLTARPTVVSMFYTRCETPNKCSLTVTKMGYLQKALREAGLEDEVNLALISYDPGWDNPGRLRSYGERRGFEFSNTAKAFRVDPKRFDEVRDFFDLQVNYSTSIVNQHRIETYVTDRRGRVSTSFTRMQWEVEEVKEAVKGELKGGRWQKGGDWLRNLSAVILPFLVAFFPKCPMCWASYLSAFGIAGLENIPYSPWLLPVFMVGIGINLWVLYRVSKRRNGMIPFYLSGGGAILLMALGVGLGYQWALYSGIALIFAGSLLNSLPFNLFMRWKARILGWWPQFAS